MDDLQDPFLVCVHLIVDPGQRKPLQRAADGVLAWVHPELQLLRVSERASFSGPRRRQSGGRPALAVIVFLQEEQALMLQRVLRRPPWRYHHTEEVSNAPPMLSPCSQDFFTLSSGTPLWAVRQINCGKEVARFTVYCRQENYVHMVRLYKLLLQRGPAQRKEDFCFFVVYSNPEMEVQLSFKRLPTGQRAAALEAAVMEVRVPDVGALVPLLPRPCCPISDVRWRTEDYDGNKILLQVRASHPVSGSVSAPSTFLRSSASDRNCRHYHRSSSRPRVQHPVVRKDHQEQQDQCSTWMPDDRGHRSGSLSPRSSRGPLHRSPSLHRSPFLVPPFRLNLDALIGARETDVDTGDMVNPGGSVDLSVVSACFKPAPPAGEMGAFPPWGSIPTCPACTSLGGVPTPSPSDGSSHQSDCCSVISARVEEQEEQEQEGEQEQGEREEDQEQGEQEEDQEQGEQEEEEEQQEEEQEEKEFYI
ncbi:protein FAM124A [Pungitius pungitius]|uniref:protein FAM124A n=1 Tax=Pungitius pungitius TaxID=134920 RepID=UPI002E13FE77